ncbi:hypothetical protein B0H11DRAFT_2005396 [Mycena galericulata]|nr:hypothetical protein B0H11DRAFT_2005396 [Mycena galericulata]
MAAAPSSGAHWTPGGPYDTQLTSLNPSPRLALLLRQLPRYTIRDDPHLVYPMLREALGIAPGDSFLLVRLARAELYLEAIALARQHWVEAQTAVGIDQDPLFDKTFAAFCQWHDKVVQEDDEFWYSHSDGGIPWHPVCPLSDCLANEVESGALKTRWLALQGQPDGSENFQRYWRLLHIDSMELEGVFALTGNSRARLVRVGFWHGAVESGASIHLTSFSIDAADAIVNVLKACDETTQMILHIIDHTSEINSAWIHSLHATAMRCSQISEAVDDGEFVRYLTPGGMPREQTSYTTLVDDDTTIVQYAPWREIPIEIETYVSELMRLLEQLEQNQVSALAVAAWAHSAFVLIHPYADGNGRISRLLASIPLLKAGLPPMTINTVNRVPYFAACTSATRGDLGPMMEEIKEGADRALDFLGCLEPSGPDDARFRTTAMGGMTRLYFPQH